MLFRSKGVYNIYEQQLNLFTPNKQRVTEKVEVDIASQELDQHVGEREAQQLRDDLELVDGVYPAFEVDTYRSADVAPVFFGSALNNFGVQELLDCFVQIAPSPRPTKAEERMVEPTEPKFSGFIFILLFTPMISAPAAIALNTSSLSCASTSASIPRFFATSI